MAGSSHGTPFKMKGWSPFTRKTRFVDKVKSGWKAVTTSLAKVNPVSYPLLEQISDKYGAYKKQYRKADAKK